MNTPVWTYVNSRCRNGWIGVPEGYKVLRKDDKTGQVDPGFRIFPQSLEASGPGYHALNGMDLNPGPLPPPIQEPQLV